MKKHILMVVAAVLLGSMSFAQSAGPRGGAPGGKSGQVKPGQGQRGPGGGMGVMGGGVQKKVLDQLGLSAAQKTKIEALNKARAEKMKTMREKMKANKTKPDPTAMQATFKKMNDEYQASLKGILTSSQFSKYDSLMKAEIAKFKKDRAGGPGKAGGPGGKAGKGGKGGKG